MAAKGTAKPNAAKTNQFKMEIPGHPDTFWTRISSLKSELITTELADRTVQSTGAVGITEGDADQHVHHPEESIALEAMFLAAKTGAPGHKVGALVYMFAEDFSTIKATFLLVGFMITARETPELTSGEDGEAVLVTWSFKCDDVIRLL